MFQPPFTLLLTTQCVCPSAPRVLPTRHNESGRYSCLCTHSYDAAIQARSKLQAIAVSGLPKTDARSFIYYRPLYCYSCTVIIFHSNSLCSVCLNHEKRVIGPLSYWRGLILDQSTRGLQAHFA